MYVTVGRLAITLNQLGMVARYLLIVYYWAFTIVEKHWRRGTRKKNSSPIYLKSISMHMYLYIYIFDLIRDVCYACYAIA